MKKTRMMKTRLGLMLTSLVVVLPVLVLVGRSHSDETSPAAKGTGRASEPAATSPSPTEATPEKKPFKGKVVKVSEALQRRGIKAYAEELKDQVALETPTELIPILPDWRGRAFYQDERLRDRDVELIGFRRNGLPYLNVLSVYTFDEKGRRQYTDYWCDICSIPMYEIKPCDCCQQEIRLRFSEETKSEISNPKSETNLKSQ